MENLEWSWDNGSIILPLAFQPREWNAAYITMLLAEYSGSKVYITHVTEEGDGKVGEEFKREVEGMATEMRVEYEHVSIEPSKSPDTDQIARVIVETAEEKKAQAIVMSAHRESKFREIFGRVSDKVSRLSSTKVILVETPKKGIRIPRNPKKILIPVLKRHSKEPFVIAAALTSSAATADAQINAIKVVELPHTLPIDALETGAVKAEKREFELFVSGAVGALGRVVIPLLLPVREVGRDLAEFAENSGTDVMVLYSSRATGFYGFLSLEEYEIVKKASCVVLVTLPARTRG